MFWRVVRSWWSKNCIWRTRIFQFHKLKTTFLIYRTWYIWKKKKRKSRGSLVMKNFFVTKKFEFNLTKTDERHCWSTLDHWPWYSFSRKTPYPNSKAIEYINIFGPYCIIARHWIYFVSPSTESDEN